MLSSAQADTLKGESSNEWNKATPQVLIPRGVRWVAGHKPAYLIRTPASPICTLQIASSSLSAVVEQRRALRAARQAATAHTCRARKASPHASRTGVQQKEGEKEDGNGLLGDLRHSTEDTSTPANPSSLKQLSVR